MDPTAVAATWFIHFSMVTTRTVGMVEATGEKRGVERAPIVTMGVNAVYLVKRHCHRKEEYSLETKRAHAAPLEIQYRRRHMVQWV